MSDKDGAPDTSNGHNRRRLIKSLWAQAGIVTPAVALVIAGFVLAYQFVDPAAPDRVVMATGSQSGAYHAFGKAYADRFAEEGIDLVLKSSAGSSQNLDHLKDEDGDIEVAFLQGGIGKAADHPNLQALGSIYYEPIWVFVRDKANPRRLTELAGKRIAVGGKGSGTRAVALNLLADNGITGENTGIVEIGGAKSADALSAGEVDAAIFVTSVTSKTVRRLLSQPTISLMSFERADAYLRRNSFLSKVVLPKGTVDLALNLPAEDTVLLAPAATIVANERLHPVLIDLFLLTMHDIHRHGSHLEAAGEFPSPHYVSYPLEPTADRFYERGPPFLQRYLPFSAANLLDRLKIMLLPLLTLLYPLFKILPPAYRWRMRSKVDRWYKELQSVDDRMRLGEISKEEARRRLGEIEDSVEQVSVPAGFASGAYTLRLHIELLRRKLDD